MDVVDSTGSECTVVDIPVGLLGLDVVDCSFTSSPNVVTLVGSVVSVST